MSCSGAVLSLPDAGVSLLIPEGAVPAGQVEDVYLAVADDARERPPLSGERGRGCTEHRGKWPARQKLGTAGGTAALAVWGTW